MDNFKDNETDIQHLIISSLEGTASEEELLVLQKWLEEGMTTSVEEMAQMAQNIMLHGMDFLWGIQTPAPPTAPAPRVEQIAKSTAKKGASL